MRLRGKVRVDVRGYVRVCMKESESKSETEGWQQKYRKGDEKAVKWISSTKSKVKEDAKG